MSKPQPSQKQMILQQLMLAVAVFMGVQLMCNKPQGPVDTRTSAEIFGDVAHPEKGAPPVPPVQSGQAADLTKGTMCWLDSVIQPSTLMTVKGLYEKKIDEETDAQKKALAKSGLTPADLKSKEQQIDDAAAVSKLKGDILLADTQYKYSLTRNDTNLMRSGAYGLIQGLDRKLQGTPLWSQEFPVPQAALEPQRFAWSPDGSQASGGVLVQAIKVSVEQLPNGTSMDHYPAPGDDPTSVTIQTLPSGHWIADTPGFYRFPGSSKSPISAPSTGISQISVKDLNARLVTDISSRNRVELTWGIFPGFNIIDALVNATGAKPGFSYAFAAFLLALCVRILVFPLVQKQLMWGRKMQQLAPLVKEIKASFSDNKGKVTNPQELQQRTMALYQEYGLNPLAGCLPAAVQMPLFFTVYNFMLHYQFAFKKGTFLWINASTSAASHGFFAPDLGSRDYVLIVIYGITMVVSTLLMPVSDPTQVKQQRLMGVGMGLLFTFMMFTGAFPTPAAFVLYWVFTNLLATAQSLRAYRLPIPPLEKVNTKPGGVFPMPPPKDGGSGGIGKPNGKPTSPIVSSTGTGRPAKHTPKKRK